MQQEIQELLTHTIVAAACIYLSFRAWKRFKQQKNKKCSGSCACKSKKLDFKSFNNQASEKKH